MESAAFRASSISTITFPASLETIGASAFSGCKSLRSVVFPEKSNLRTIKENAFYGSGLQEFVAPGKLETIEKEAFRQSKVERVVLEGAVTTLGNGAFKECWQLKTLVLGASIKNVDYYVFYNCKGLERVELYTTALSTTFTDLDKLKTVVIGGARTTSGSFQYCDMLEEVVFQGDIQKIDNNAFLFCGNLKRITIPDTVTAIGKNALLNTGITSLTVPASVTTIGSSALSSTTLKEVEFLGDYSTDFHMNAFGDSVVKVYYPKDNPTWTQEVRDSFTSTVTWIPR